MSEVELSRVEQERIIVRHFMEESGRYKAAGEVLRTTVDSRKRAQALGERALRLRHCDALLDAHLQLEAIHD